MNKMFLGMLALVLVSVSVQAQYADAKAASRALNKFHIGPQASKEELRKAVVAILPDPIGEDVADPKFYILKGEILNTLSNKIIIVKQTGLGSLEDYPKVEMVAVRGYKAYETALEKHVQAINSPGYLLRDALKGILEAQGLLYSFGSYAFAIQDYESAYLNFSSILASHDILKKAGEESTLDDAQAMMDQKYVTGMAALNNNMPEAAKPLFEDLYMANYDNPAIYEALYSIMSREDDANQEVAYQYLKAGREKYPEEVSLLFVEINHFLKINKLDELIDMLKRAINSEPDNPTLYITLGGVYDNLYQREFAAGNRDKARNYFEEAVNYYNQSLEKDPTNFDALYSIGALYYNRAATLTMALSELSSDNSPAGMEKYKAIEAEVFSAFDKSLPYFQKAERINPNSVPTLLALKEIYTRNNQPETSNALEERLAKVQGGGMNETSFFEE
jgi:tetratricopeptide (TPR) repeat protein